MKIIYQMQIFVNVMISKGVLEFYPCVLATYVITPGTAMCNIVLISAMCSYSNSLLIFWQHMKSRNLQGQPAKVCLYIRP